MILSINRVLLQIYGIFDTQRKLCGSIIGKPNIHLKRIYNSKSNFYSKTQYLKVSWVADSFKYFMVSGLNEIQYNVTVVVLRFLQAQILVKKQ